MTRFSSELPHEAVRIDHTSCGGSSAVFAIEWPPKIVVCPNCGTHLKLVGHDKDTQSLSYRRI